jgi:hypothetical protein
MHFKMLVTRFHDQLTVNPISLLKLFKTDMAQLEQLQQRNVIHSTSVTEPSCQYIPTKYSHQKTTEGRSNDS